MDHSAKERAAADLSVEFAGEISALAAGLAGCTVFMCNQEAVVVGASRKESIGTICKEAQFVLSGNKDEHYVTAEEAAEKTGRQEGCTVAISLDGRKIGALAITGHYEIVRPVAQIISAVIHLRLRENRQRQVIFNVVSAVADEVKNAIATIEEINAGSAEVATTTSGIATATELATKKVVATSQILEINRKVAGQITLLGFNASIEAARAGEHGRGFSVVAKEIQKLAADSSAASENIKNILWQIQQSVKEVEEAVHYAALISGEQAQVMQGFVQGMETIQNHIARIKTAL